MEFNNNTNCYAFLPNAQLEIQALSKYFEQRECLTQDQTSYYQEKIKFHLENTESCYKEAKDKCWWLPDLDYRERAKECFNAAMATFGTSDPKSKLVLGVLTLLTQYGIDCCNEWDFIHNKLHWAEYHYELMEFYQSVIIYE